MQLIRELVDPHVLGDMQADHDGPLHVELRPPRISYQTR